MAEREAVTADGDSPMTAHALVVPRTARYYTLGPTHGFPRELWFVCHGFGQLAGRFIRQFASLDDGTIVAAREGGLLATSFHPELTADPRFHALFVAMAAAYASPGEGASK